MESADILTRAEGDLLPFLKDLQEIFHKIFDENPQVSIPYNLKSSIFHLRHHTSTVWHLRGSKLYYAILWGYYWASISVDFYET